MHLRLSTSALFAACLLLGGSGCGRQMSKVEGVVTLDGQPVDGATVTFIPDGGGVQASGMTGSDGVFRLSTRNPGDGAAHGTYKIIITKVEAKDYGAASAGNPSDPDYFKKGYGQFVKDQKDKKKGKDKPKVMVPAVYGEASNTPLKATVPADGPIKIELRSAGG